VGSLYICPSHSSSDNSLTAQTILPFDLRPQPHSLVETLNPHLPSSSDLGGTGVPAGSKSRVALTSVADLKHWDYRYMFEKISQRSEALDDLIDDFAESIREAYGIHELGDPHFVSDDPIHTVGRILSMPTDGGKVTSTSLYLESSRLLGGGKRVSLRFPSSSTLRVRGGAPGVKGFGVFPGCLVCVKGRNGGGGAFVVDEVLMVSGAQAIAKYVGSRAC
jgi:DNA polymerase alpha subunit B